MILKLNVSWDTGESGIRPANDLEIKKVADIMRLYPQVNALIKGYSDDRGSVEAKERLSEKRAGTGRLRKREMLQPPLLPPRNIFKYLCEIALVLALSRGRRALPAECDCDYNAFSDRSPSGRSTSGAVTAASMQLKPFARGKTL